MKLSTMREINPKETTRAYAFELWMKAPMPMVTFFKILDVSNYSAPIEVSPIGMSDHLTVLQQQELHCISNFRSS